MSTVKITLIAQDQASGQVQRFATVIGQAGQAATAAAQQVRGLESSVAGARAGVAQAQAAVKGYEAELIKAKAATGAKSEETKKLKASLDAARVSVKEAQGATKELEAGLIKARDAAKQAGDSFGNLKNHASSASGGMGNLKDGLGGLANGLGGAAGAAGMLATGGMAAAGVAVGALAVGVVSLAADFESSMAKLQVATGITDKNSQAFKQLSAAAKEVGQSTKFNSKEAADGMAVLAQQGLNTEQVLKAIGPAAQAAEINEVGLAEASKTLSVVMNAFGIEASKTGKIVDITTKAAAMGVLNFNDFNLAMSAVGSVAKLANQSLESTTSGILALTNAGQSAQDAGTSIKSALLALTNPSNEAKAAIQQLGLSVYDSNGNMRQWSDIVSQVEANTKGMTAEQRNQLLATIAGSDGIRAFAGSLGASAKVMQDGKEVTLQGSAALKYWEEQLKNSDGTAKKAAETLRATFGAQLDNLKGSLEEAGISVGKALLPALTEVTKFATQMVNKISDGMQPLLDKVMPVITGIGKAFTEYLEPVINGIMAGLKNAFDVLEPAFAELSKALGETGVNASSLGQIMGGVLGTTLTVVANGIAFLVRASANAIEFFKDFWGVVSTLLKPLGDVANVIINVAKGLGLFKDSSEKASGGLGNFGDKATEAGQNSSAFGNAIQTAGNAAKEAGAKAQEGAKAATDGQGKATDATNKTTEAQTKSGEAAKQAGQAAAESAAKQAEYQLKAQEAALKQEEAATKLSEAQEKAKEASQELVKAQTDVANAANVSKAAMEANAAAVAQLTQATQEYDQASAYANNVNAGQEENQAGLRAIDAKIKQLEAEKLKQKDPKVRANLDDEINRAKADRLNQEARIDLKQNEVNKAKGGVDNTKAAKEEAARKEKEAKEAAIKAEKEHEDAVKKTEAAQKALRTATDGVRDAELNVSKVSNQTAQEMLKASQAAQASTKGTAVAFNQVGTAAGAAGQQISTGLGGPLGQLPGQTDAAMQGVNSAVGSGLQQTAATAQTGGAAIGKAAGDGIGIEGVKAITAGMKGVQGAVEAGFQELESTVLKSGENIVKGLSEVINKNGEALKAGLSKVEDAVKASSEKIDDSLKKLIDQAAKDADTLVKTINSSSEKGFGGIERVLNEIKELIKSFLSGVKLAGSQFGDNLADGIAGSKDKVVAAVQGVAQAASNAMASGGFLDSITGGSGSNNQPGKTPPAFTGGDKGTGSGGGTGGTQPGGRNKDSIKSLNNDDGMGGPANHGPGFVPKGPLHKNTMGIGGVGDPMMGKSDPSSWGYNAPSASLGGQGGHQYIPNTGYAAGLERVPYDGFLALLHKNEMVAPPGMAEDLRNAAANGGAGNGGGGGGTVVNIYLDSQKIAEIMLDQTGRQFKTRSGSSPML